MTETTARRWLLRSTIVLAALLLTAGVASAGPGPGFCVCIDAGGHCISFC